MPAALQILETLLAGVSLTEEQTQQALEAVVDGAHQSQMAAFLVLLRAKACLCILNDYLHVSVRW
jgi:anthranilate phosphoribosyltransferase